MEYNANSSIGKKRGCPKCAIRSLDRTHEEYVALMKEIHPTIEVLGEYVNTTVKVELKCKVCNHTWSAAPANSITGSKRLSCLQRITFGEGNKKDINRLWI